VFEKRGLLGVSLVLFLLVLSSFLVFGEISGCYIYPKASEDLYCEKGIFDTEAQKDCSTHADCSMKDSFLPGTDCAAVPQCKSVTCNLDCQVKPLGICTQLGGSAVAAEDYNQWCSPGCCKVADKFCQFNVLKYQCQDKAKKLGFATDFIFDSTLGMDSTKCNAQYCKVTVEKGSLKGYVRNEKNEFVSSVALFLEGTSLKTITLSDGKYEFLSLNPGTYVLKVVGAGYLPVTFSFTLKPAQVLDQNFTMTPAVGLGVVSGTVFDDNGKQILGATVSWSGPVSGQKLTDETGKFEVKDLLAGDYQFIVSKIGLKSEKKIISVSASGAVVDFKLGKAALQGVKGKIYVDSDNNKQLDISKDKTVYGAKIFIDGVFRGYSAYPDGSFEFSIDVKGGEEHNISAHYLDFNAKSIKVNIKSGESSQKDLLLTAYEGECSKEGSEKDVASFVIVPVPGKKALSLKWEKPCAEVQGYQITRYKGDEDAGSFSVSPYDVTYVDLDDSLLWEQEYHYDIIAVYTHGTSAAVASNSMSIGDEKCEGRYHDDTGWESFCVVGDEKFRKTVWSCNDLNQLIGSDCGEKDVAGAESYYCAKTAAGKAECKNAGPCLEDAGPFGLYYQRQSCYDFSSSGNNGAINAKNFCYYDYSTYATLDECKSCTVIKNCFDYVSKDACQVNNCLGTPCLWVDGALHSDNLLVNYQNINLPGMVSKETGAGYCAEENYKKDDQCGLCSSTASLFENYFCTAEVCSGLGACFSKQEMTQCKSCGQTPRTDANCYTYATEMECTSGNPVHKDPLEKISSSKDRCNWGRCLWQGSCMKDSDGDGQDDCSGFTAGEYEWCKIDNTAPRTSLVDIGVAKISSAKQTIQFHGDDAFHKEPPQRSRLSKLKYCLTSADARFPNDCTTGNFMDVFYLGQPNGDEILTINIFNSSFLQTQISGETYKLLYYSIDKYHNQEDVQQAFVFIDNVPPQFEINEKINTNIDTTDLTVFLEGMNEPMTCTFALQQVIPLSAVKALKVEREKAEKQVTFSDLKSVRSDLNVTCVDDLGNMQTKMKSYTFDMQQKINVLYPEIRSVIAATDINFKAHTDVGASCELYSTLTNEKMADFKITDTEGKEHETGLLSGFVEKNYAAEHKVVCKELLTGEILEDYFDFMVDFTAPITHVVLKEGAREVRPLDYGWIEYFISDVKVDFECLADGFKCDKTYYCLGEGCEDIHSSNYKEYSGTVDVNKTTQICYYSKDFAQNPVYQPLCGDVRVEGYGLMLEKPTQYYYLNEKWGVSDHIPFTWQFYSKVPTSECRFDFVSGFDYDNVPPYKILGPDGDGKYVVNEFPTAALTSYNEEGGVKALYLKCKNKAGEIGPETKFNLEYDPRGPVILDVHAEPTLVLEGVTANLLVKTDDKTLCRYSDVSSSEGSYDYNTMEYAFPGASDGILNYAHKDVFTVNVVDPSGKKDYHLAVQCRNGAGTLSDVKEIIFSVDYSAAGFISYTKPSGYLTSSDILLDVGTSKKAFCDYNINGTYYSFTNGQNEKAHNTLLSNLDEGEFDIPLRCVMGDTIAEGDVHFVIDTTAPIITNITDGNLSCGVSATEVMVYTSEQNISAYYYEVYDLGEDKNLFAVKANTSSKIGSSYSSSYSSYSSYSYSSYSYSSASTNLSSKGTAAKGTLVYNATVGPSLPIKVPLLNLNGNNLSENHKYVVRVRAGDGAGNWGDFKESDGFDLVSANYSVCVDDKDAPQVPVLINNSGCSAVIVELKCDDAVGCNQFKYGKELSEKSCNANLTYSGQKITFDQSGFICYTVSDNIGHNFSSSKLISFADQDGDGVSDSCDQCTKTSSGKIVDVKGCASNEAPAEKGNVTTSVKQDTDKDKLPDEWEKIHNAEGCDFNPFSKDSNANGVFDNEEDYDADGLSNYDEYTQSSDPCSAEKVLSEEEIASETQKPVKKETLPSLSASSATEFNVVAFVFLIFGLVLMFGGAGYLVYYYKNNLRSSQGGSGEGELTSGAKPSTENVKLTDSSFGKFSFFKKQLQEKQKTRQRESAFAEFRKESSTIPHVGPLLGKSASLTALQQVAQKYVDHKDEIKPGLKKEEKSIFARLENIGKQTQDKSIHDVVSKDEAKDIFSQLKSIAQKRKSGK